MTTEHLLAEFEAWCKGEGRPPGAGKHWSSLEAIARFRLFKRTQQRKLELLEKIAKKG